MPSRNIFGGQSARALFAHYVYEELRKREFVSLVDVLCIYYKREKSYYDLHTIICVIKSKRIGRESCICVSAKFASSKNLIGKKIVVLEESENTNPTTKADYPYFATKTKY